MSYPPKLTAALTGATIRQLSHWRSSRAPAGAVLVPEISSGRPLLYSFRDVVALRTCVRLRQETSLQKIRRALDTLREDLGLGGSLPRAQIHPDNVWALRGLLDCLERRGDTAEAALIRQRVEIAAARADMPVAVSCFCARDRSA